MVCILGNLWVTERDNSPLPMLPQERWVMGQFCHAHNFRPGLPTHLPTWLTLMCYLSEVQDLFSWVMKSGTAVPHLWPQRELSHLPQVLIRMGEVHLSPGHAIIWQMRGGSSLLILSTSGLAHTYLHNRFTSIVLPRKVSESALWV